MSRHLTRGSAALLAALALALTAALAAFAVSAGPPYPEPVEGRAVYDFADVLSPEVEQRLESMIDAIEERVGAEIAVYTQIKPESDTPEEAEADAIALIDQWGIGRRGFDDGLVILYDLDDSRCHGQVQLYAGPGYRATFLDNAERQRIFDEEMVPRLADCDIEGATLVAMEHIDANATPEHARALELARQVDAALGLIGAPVVFMLLVGWALLRWLQFGRDPQYLDDASILMPAPPPEMTAATGALIVEGSTTRRALTTAMLDLASRGEIAFRDESALMTKKLGVQVLPPAAREDPQVFRNRRKPISAAEESALGHLIVLADKGSSYVDPDQLLKFGTDVSDFNDRLEQHAVAKGWFREPPGKAITRWAIRGFLEIVAGVITFIVGVNIPSAGLVLIALALVAAGIVTLVIAHWMPARTTAGAMVYAMLAAYRRTLQRTLDQARSMRQVVESHVVPWLETPDQAVVWGVALGLHDEVQRVLERSLEDLRRGGPAAQSAWLPYWYGTSGTTFGSSGSGPGWAGVAPGLMSASAIPNFGGMMAALGTIGNTPSSSGSGGGGFGGGSSGGGGGGSGGGF